MFNLNWERLACHQSRLPNTNHLGRTGLQIFGFAHNLQSNLCKKKKKQKSVLKHQNTTRPQEKGRNLRKSGQFLGRVGIPKVDPPAGAAEGGGGENRSVWREVAGGQEA